MIGLVDLFQYRKTCWPGRKKNVCMLFHHADNLIIPIVMLQLLVAQFRLMNRTEPCIHT